MFDSAAMGHIASDFCSINLNLYPDHGGGQQPAESGSRCLFQSSDHSFGILSGTALLSNINKFYFITFTICGAEICSLVHRVLEGFTYYRRRMCQWQAIQNNNWQVLAQSRSRVFHTSSSHVYWCRQFICEYAVALRRVNSWEVKSA